ncbi:hypothetical protein BKA69DRAFT_2241 [Paraphysoderma sedebokerense]|nr:hypothetical protein BKA69DRAFT_2241 [Paraphysoderma sedebokerense]
MAKAIFCMPVHMLLVLGRHIHTIYVKIILGWGPMLDSCNPCKVQLNISLHIQISEMPFIFPSRSRNSTSDSVSSLNLAHKNLPFLSPPSTEVEPEVTTIFDISEFEPPDLGTLKITASKSPTLQNLQIPVIYINDTKVVDIDGEEVNNDCENLNPNQDCAEPRKLGTELVGSTIVNVNSTGNLGSSDVVECEWDFFEKEIPVIRTTPDEEKKLKKKLSLSSKSRNSAALLSPTGKLNASSATLQSMNSSAYFGQNEGLGTTDGLKPKKKGLFGFRNRLSSFFGESILDIEVKTDGEQQLPEISKSWLDLPVLQPQTTME